VSHFQKNQADRGPATCFGIAASIAIDPRHRAARSSISGSAHIVCPITIAMAKQKKAVPQLQETAERLREARQACSIFLDLWAITRLRDPRSLDRVAADLGNNPGATSAEIYNTDWSHLYRGNVLDD
jgi:hypothetical protein